MVEIGEFVQPMSQIKNLKGLISRPFCRWCSSLEALKRGLEEALKELRPDP